MVAILTEPGYADSVWGRNLYRGLVAQLRQKRIPFCEIADVCPAEADGIFVISANSAWTRQAVEQLNQAGRQPILLCSRNEPIPGCAYSSVCSDIHASMRELLAVLKQHGKHRLALYGVGSTSIADSNRVHSLNYWMNESFAPLQILYNAGSLRNCFDNFYPRRREFDAIICVNEYAAVSLVRRLRQLDPEYLTTATVFSPASTQIQAYYRENITAYGVHVESVGKAALFIYECMLKNPFVSDLHMTVKWNQEEAREYRQAELMLPERIDEFYDDPEIVQMLIADRYLSVSDTVDRDIVSRILRGETYQSIADACFLTEGTVKYRIKRLVAQCGAQSKAELLSLLRKYLPAESFGIL